MNQDLRIPAKPKAWLIVRLLTPKAGNVVDWMIEQYLKTLK